MENIHFSSNQLISIQTEEEFNQQALKTFDYQLEHVKIYRDFCKSIHQTQPKTYREIPCLPISFFKTHRIVSDEIMDKNLLHFMSSGTTHLGRSHHFIAQPKIYEDVFSEIFTQQITNPKNAIILALLPNYLEQGNSSLVYMVDHLIKMSNHPLSGFYLNNIDALIQTVDAARKTTKRIILFGVTYALLDLAEKGADLNGAIIIETGGMKGRRKEMIREEVHEKLKIGLNVENISSEYGMTELLSQAYMKKQLFTTPNWMKVMIRDINDPFKKLQNGKTGGVNVIDLANWYSCSFIATDDLGKIENQSFRILGRFDTSDIRGCNLLVN